MITANPRPCWTTPRYDDDGYYHHGTEAEALRETARRFAEAPTRPGVLPGQFTAACWLIICDHMVCGEILCDTDEEFVVHFEDAGAAVAELAEQAMELGAEGWAMTADGLTWCPAHRPGDLGQIPVPLTHAEQAEAGQGVLL